MTLRFRGVPASWCRAIDVRGVERRCLRDVQAPDRQVTTHVNSHVTLKTILANPKHHEHEDMKRWIPKGWSSQAFSWLESRPILEVAALFVAILRRALKSPAIPLAQPQASAAPLLETLLSELPLSARQRRHWLELGSSNGDTYFSTRNNSS